GVKPSTCAREDGRRRSRRIFVVSVVIARPNGYLANATESTSEVCAATRASSRPQDALLRRLRTNWMSILIRCANGPAHLANQGAHGRQPLLAYQTKRKARNRALHTHRAHGPGRARRCVEGRHKRQGGRSRAG